MKQLRGRTAGLLALLSIAAAAALTAQDPAAVKAR
jgi:hypothetical protein